MSNALDAAQAAFYCVASLGVIGGAVIAVRRYILERPHMAAWELNWGEAILRTMPGDPPHYAHSFAFLLTNRSLAFQTFVGFWVRVEPHSAGDDGAFGKIDRTQFDRTRAGLQEFFGRDMFAQSTTVGPGGSVRFGQTLTAAEPVPMLRVRYAAVGLRPRLWRGGFHKELVFIQFGTQSVSVRHEDLDRANASGARSGMDASPAAANTPT